MSGENTSSQPWYKEFWGWMVFAPLILVVVASCFTVFIAFYHADDVVGGRVEKKGRAYHKDFSANEFAQKLDIHGKMNFDWHTQMGEIEFDQSTNIPPHLIHFYHPFDKKFDRTFRIIINTDHFFSFQLPNKFTGKWYVALESENLPGKYWRIDTQIDFDHDHNLSF